MPPKKYEYNYHISSIYISIFHGNIQYEKKDIYLFSHSNSILQDIIYSSYLSILYCCTKGYSIRNKFHPVLTPTRNYYCTNKDRWEIPQYALKARNKAR
jgi:hypothetical protein